MAKNALTCILCFLRFLLFQDENLKAYPAPCKQALNRRKRRQRRARAYPKTAARQGTKKSESSRALIGEARRSMSTTCDNRRSSSYLLYLRGSINVYALGTYGVTAKWYVKSATAAESATTRALSPIRENRQRKSGSTKNAPKHATGQSTSYAIPPVLPGTPRRDRTRTLEIAT